MKYRQITIHTSSEGIEEVITMLMGMGIDNAVIEDPKDVYELLEKKNSYDWDYISEEVVGLKEEMPKVLLYFEENEENKSIIQQIKLNAMHLKSKEMEGNFPEGYLGRMYVEDELCDDSEWKDNWKEYFKPAKVSEKIVVKPTWEEYTAKDGELIIEIDPGMAFGTGTHETTSLCLKLMEKYISSNSKVLDIGSGSGILSIGASLLGAEDVLGVDIDPIAVEVSRSNVRLNNLDNKIVIMQGDLTEGIDYKGDVVVANLMADLVVMLSEDVAKHMNDEGVFISSGILVNKKEYVQNALLGKGFEILEAPEDGEWCAIAAKLLLT